MYKDGRVCISILHSAGDDPHGYETAAERWSPVQSVSLTQALLPEPESVNMRGLWILSYFTTSLSLNVLRQDRILQATKRNLLKARGCLSKRPLQVETIMLSIISMLSSPNDESPANIDAAKEWREDREGFKKRVARVVRKSQESL